MPIGAPQLPIYSCTTAAPYPNDPDEILHLMIDHWVRPVEFRRTIDALYADGVRVFVEVGPRGNLTAFVEDILRGRSFCAAPVNVQHRSGITQLNHCVGLLMAQGVNLDLTLLYARRQPRVVTWDHIPAPASRGVKLVTSLPVLRISPAVAENIRRAPTILEQPPTPPDGEAWLPLPPQSTPVVQRADLAIGDAPLPADDSQHMFAAAPQVQGDLISQAAIVEPAPAFGDMAAGTFAEATMSAYLETMDAFLRAQSQVMGAYLSGVMGTADAASTPEAAPGHAHALMAQRDNCTRR